MIAAFIAKIRFSLNRDLLLGFFLCSFERCLKLFVFGELQEQLIALMNFSRFLPERRKRISASAS
jgi:hypothetical protein